jgi:hypothetical protein
MLRTQYAILCEHSNQRQNGTWDLLATFDRLFVAGLPAIHQNLAFVVLLVSDSEDDLGRAPFRFTLTQPDQKLLIDHRGELEVLRPTGGTWLVSTRAQFALQDVPFMQYGKYTFRLEVREKEAATHPLSVVRIAPNQVR